MKDKKHMKRSPTISIAMATYNGGRFLREQLDSLYSQSLLADEIVVCDDGSTDNTLDILEEYHQRYGLKYFVNKHNIGVNANFIRAFSMCSGKYIFISDQDDIWLPNKIEILYNKISSLDDTIPTAVSSLRYDIDANRNIIGGVSGPLTQGWQATLLTCSRSQGCAMVMNRCLCDIIVKKASQSPDLVYQMYFDEMVAYTAVCLGIKINLPDQLMYYRHHDKNVVDRYHGHLSFKQKVGAIPTFWGFVIDERLIPLCAIKKLYEKDIVDTDLQAFLSSVENAMAQPTTWSKLVQILRIKQLSIPHRMNIMIHSCISIVLKRFYHYPTI